MPIKFDDIHTEKKQFLLDEMMRVVTNEIHKIDEGEKNKKRESCPVCNHRDIAFFTEKYGFYFDRCAACGLLFCNPYPTDEQIHYYYNSDMKNFENDFFMESFENRVQIFLPRIDIINKYKTRGSLLDVGSSVGVFIEALNRVNHHFDITCCDISEDACNRLKQRFPNTNIINSDFKLLKGSVKYDIMTMWDTVEHIIDLDGLFHSVKSILLEEGVFIFSTPNTKSFEWIIANKEHVQLLPPGHVNLLNIDNIKILLKRHSFDMLDTYTLNPSLDIDYILKSARQNKINPVSIGVFLEKMLMDEEFRTPFEKLLKEQGLAGNIVVAAKNKSNNDVLNRRGSK